MKELGHKEWTHLPLWMRSIQSDGKAPLGFVMAVPICYCLPGTSALVKKRIEDKNLKFKNIQFTIDRYQISNSKITPATFTADGSTTEFELDEIVHEEDILVSLKLVKLKDDINLPLQLRKVYGHINMGVYLIPLNDGMINIDNEVKLII